MFEYENMSRVQAGAVDVLTRDDIYHLHCNLRRFFETLSDHEKNAFDKSFINFVKLHAYAELSAPPEKILNARELLVFKELLETPFDLAAAQSDTMIIVLKCTRLCNLRCTYCNAWREGPGHVMPFAVLARTIRDALNAPGVKNVEFVWHGGEPTMLGKKFYKKALWLQEYFCPKGVNCVNAMQTNAVDISDAMLDFFSIHDFSIGISFDGPPSINDCRRIDKEGKGTSERILQTIKKLKSRNVNFGALVVIDRPVTQRPVAELLDYFSSIGIPSLDVLNVLPENACAIVGSYLPFPEYVDYLCRLFTEWNSHYKEKLEIRTFSSLLKTLSSGVKGICVFSGDCQGKYITIESDGSIAACDKYVGDRDYHYGSIFDGGMFHALANSGNLTHAKKELALYTQQSSGCKWYSVCHGGCPHDRKLSRKFLHHNAGEEGCCGLSSLLELMASTINSAQSRLEF